MRRRSTWQAPLFESGKDQWQQRDWRVHGVPISTHLLYQLIDVRHAQFGFTWLLLLAAILAAILFWKRQAAPGWLWLWHSMPH